MNFFQTKDTDNEPPRIEIPDDITVNTTRGEASAVVTWDDVLASDNSGFYTITHPPTHLQSGSTFPIGNTTITYTARDMAGNIAEESFVITVKGNAFMFANLIFETVI